jgi:glycosyltransferase involved in cell wall biosynthesis
MDQRSTLPTYVLITPARNEEAFIEKTLESMVRQTVLPVKWVIVNDGSTDATASIVSRYLEKNPWIELVTLGQRKERHFAAKVYAFNAGRERLQNVEYKLIGNLDGDVSLDPDHFEFLLRKIKSDPKLGVAGTIFKEENYSSETDSFEGQNHVSGQCQLFRRECFEEIGGYCPNKAGGIDWAGKPRPFAKSGFSTTVTWERQSAASSLRCFRTGKKIITSAAIRSGSFSASPTAWPNGPISLEDWRWD